MRFLKTTLSLLFIICYMTAGAQTVEDIDVRASVLYNSLKVSNKRALKKFNDPKRKQWSLNPKKKRGVSISSIKEVAEFDSLMASVLDERFSLEALDRTFQQFGKADYYLCFYGEPDTGRPWGFSLEGPYVSMNFTIVREHFSFTPFVFGANPSFIPREGENPLDIMSTQDGIPAALMSKFPQELLDKALVSKTAPSKMKYAFSQPLNYQQEGISLQEFDHEDQNTFMSMAMSVYMYQVPEGLNAEIYDRFYKYRSSDLKIAWEGSIEEDALHSYRITTPTILIEYINLEANKNNAYFVFREKGYDFGEGYLK